MSRKTRYAAVGWVALMLVGVVAIADEPMQMIHAGALSFQTPKNWKSEKPSSAMRKAQIKVLPAEGDGEPAEMTVVNLVGGGGGLDANITRWERSFSSDDGKPLKAKIETKKGKNVDVTRVEIAGKYTAMSMPGQPPQDAKANTRLLGAIIITPETGYFLKLTGPDKTVASVAKQFDAMIESISVDQ